MLNRLNKIRLNKKQSRIIILLLFVVFLSCILLPSFHPSYAKEVSDGNGGTITVPDPPSANTESDVCALGLLDYFSIQVINCLLLYVLKFFGWLLAVAATIFTWVLNPENFKYVVNNPVIYKMWTIVRDVLNVTFILGILFCAFCTVFQIEKFSYKKLLITIIVMALLVNFSYPIARFVIDLSNVIMYYFVNSTDIAKGGLDSVNKSALVDITKSAALDQIINPPEKSRTDTAFLIASVFFVFIFSATLLIISILLVVRMMVLAVLVIFSSFAFAGSIVPFFSKQAGDWWDNLFKYSFFGPIMVFMLCLALRMMEEMGNNIQKQITQGATAQADNPVVGAMAFFALPIVILWIGLGVAQKLSIVGAETARKVGMGAMMRASGANYLKNRGKEVKEAYQQKRKAAAADRWSNKLGSRAGSAVDKFQSAYSSDAKHRYERDQAARIKNEHEKAGMANMTDSDLEKIANTSRDKHQKAAAVQELANHGRATAAQLDQVKSAFGETSQAFQQVAAKVRTYDPVAAFATQVDAAGTVTNFDEGKAKAFVDSSQFDLNKVQAGSAILKNGLNNDRFVEMLFDSNAISQKQAMDLAKSGPAKKNALTGSLAALAARRTDSTQDVDRNIHLANFARTGQIVDSNFASSNFTMGNDETIANMTTDTAEQYGEHVARYSKNYKKTVMGIKDDSAKRIVNSTTQHFDPTVLSALPPDQYRNVISSQSISNNDPQLQHLI